MNHGLLQTIFGFCVGVDIAMIEKDATTAPNEQLAQEIRRAGYKYLDQCEKVSHKKTPLEMGFATLEIANAFREYQNVVRLSKFFAQNKLPY